jgi:hypothetical protein
LSRKGQIIEKPTDAFQHHTVLEFLDYGKMNDIVNLPWKKLSSTRLNMMAKAMIDRQA